MHRGEIAAVRLDELGELLGELGEIDLDRRRGGEVGRPGRTPALAAQPARHWAPALGRAVVRRLAAILLARVSQSITVAPSDVADGEAFEAPAFTL